MRRILYVRADGEKKKANEKLNGDGPFTFQIHFSMVFFNPTERRINGERSPNKRTKNF